MKVPPRGERYVAASWIAAATAVAVVAIGTTVVLLSWDHMPDEVALRWTYEGPGLWITRAQVLLVGVVCVLGGSASLLGLGAAMHRSPRHQLSGPALGWAVFSGLLVYGVAFAQTRTDRVDYTTWLLPAVLLGGGTGALLHWWVRPTWSDAGAEAPRTATIDVPASSRLAWVGSCRLSWPGRLFRVALGGIPAVSILAWLGNPPGIFWWIWVAALCPAILQWGKAKQVVVDYSGVGIRSMSTPSPIPMHQIRSASTGLISIPVDFPGWGKVRAPDGREGWITRSGEALVVHRWGKPDFVFTVDGAEEAAAVLNTLLVRSEVA